MSMESVDQARNLGQKKKLEVDDVNITIRLEVLLAQVNDRDEPMVLTGDTYHNPR
jgi:hypothetical protein